MHEGLGLLPGRVVRFAPAPGLKIPHMGWNTLRVAQARAAPRRARAGARRSTSSTRTTRSPTTPTTSPPRPTTPARSPAMVWRDNLMACQFHPEKSQRVGLAMYANFAAL